MVYGLREWEDERDGEVHFEFLTAKPAQRPCRWLDWSHMRRFMLDWEGHCIMRFDARSTSSVQAGPEPMRRTPSGKLRTQQELKDGPAERDTAAPLVRAID
jgi:hypothetical protein